MERPDGARIMASPLAKRIAANKGIDLKALKGSGPHGRIIRRDVENAKPGAAQPAHGGAPLTADGLILPQVLDDRVYAPDTYELKPLDGMRKTVAQAPDAELHAGAALPAEHRHRRSTTCWKAAPPSTPPRRRT